MCMFGVRPEFIMPVLALESVWAGLAWDRDPGTGTQVSPWLGLGQDRDRSRAGYVWAMGELRAGCGRAAGWVRVPFVLN